MISVIPDRIDVDAVREAVSDPSCGAVLVFEGTARNTFEGRPVLSLRYEAHVGMAEAELRAIAAEIQGQWPGARVAMVHRTGEVALAEPSVVVAVATPHRAACYEASRYALEQLKVRVPIWKQEIYADGSEWKANAPSR